MRGRWSNIIFMNVRATSEENSDDFKESIYVELEQVLIIFLSTI
jgi:hypothetical protein